MTSVIFHITTFKGLENLERSLVNISSECAGQSICVLVDDDENLFLECRDFLTKTVDNCEFTVLWVGDSKPQELLSECLVGAEYVLYINQNIIFPHNGITRLVEDFRSHKVGFVSGVFEEYPTTCWLEDLYDNNSARIHWGERETEGDLVEVDTAFPFGVLMKKDTFKEAWLDSNLAGFGPLSYGVRLRRQGYKNYVDKRVRLKYGGEE